MITPSAIQVALNGARAPSSAPELPLLPPAIIADAQACAALGAVSFHVHPRDDHGQESIEPRMMTRWMRLFADAVPGAEISVSTGAWIAPLEARLRAIRGWCTRPHLASVNFHEPGAEQVADALLARDVGVEAGLWNTEAASRFLSYPNRGRCRRILLELPDCPPGEALRRMTEIRRVLGEQVRGHVVVIHGEGESAWALVRMAISGRLPTRIGLEDVLVLPDGTPVRSNACLFAAAVRMIQTASCNFDAPLIF